MAKIFISGGSGFIGSHLSKSLIDDGHKVYVFDQNLQYFHPLSNFAKKILDYKNKYLLNNVEKINGSSLDIFDLSRKINEIKPEYIINLGSLPLASKAIDNSEEAFKSIVETAKNFMEVLRDYKELKKFTHISSSMVYGDFVKNPINVDDKKDPKEIYGSMKLASENIVSGYSKIYKIKTSIIRPSAVYGPCDMNKRVLQKIVEGCFEKKPITLNNPKNNFLDFSYVKDVANGIKCVTLNDTSDLEVFNVTAGNARSLYELSEIIKKFFPNQEFIFNEDDSFYPKRGTLNISKTIKFADYQPQYSLEVGVEEYINFYKKFLI